MQSHTELVAWKVARASALEIHRYIDCEWSPPRRAALEQPRRASLSVILNIAEGSAFGPGPRFRFHVRVAHGSAVEVVELLEFLLDLGESVGPLLPPAHRAVRLTFGLSRAA